MAHHRPTKTKPDPSAVQGAFEASRQFFWSVAIYSGLVNLLMLAGPIYMLQIYDRVLASRSVPTLIALSTGLLVAYLFQGLFDIIRNRIVTRAAAIFNRKLAGPIHACVIGLSVKSRLSEESVQPVRDLDQVSSFLTSSGPLAIIDMLWVPVFLFLCFLLNPWIGIVSLAGSLALILLALLTEWKSRTPARALAQEASSRSLIIEADRRNSESIVAMGMQGTLEKRWSTANRRYLEASHASTDIISVYGGVSRVARLVLQSAILGVGSYLVILNELTAGSMIAASILMTRALAPVETAISNLRGFVGARQSLTRLSRAVPGLSDSDLKTQIPTPCKSLQVEHLYVSAPGSNVAILRDIRFQLEAGDALGIIGPNGAGKTSLVRTLVGAWLPAQGVIRLDGAALDQWAAADLGRHVGYLSHSVNLFEGTVAENISRMFTGSKSEDVVAAARAAGAHDMILKLAQGYDTRVGDAGAILSAGQRQRIGLARALFGNPFLVVLDEPHANLDTEGEAALTRALSDAKARRAIVIIIAHRPSMLAICDKVLLVANGQQITFGPRDKIMPRVMPKSAAPLNRKVAAN